jgi:heme A synthase
VPAWLQWTAWIVVVTAIPLVTLGAETTTKKAGMADQKSVRSPLYLFEAEEHVAGQPMRIVHLAQTGQIAMLFEHSHRLFGWIVGAQCLFLLAPGMWFCAKGGYRWLGLLALVGVTAQGLLGIARVAFNLQAGPELSALHGCSAQIVFACLAAVAVIATFSWRTPGDALPGWLRWATLGIVALVYAQLVAGAILRHLLDPLAMRLHILLAFAAVLAILWWCYQIRRHDRLSGAAYAMTLLLTLFVLVQPILGVEAWIRRFGTTMLPDEVPSTLVGDAVRSGHHVLGTLIFGSTVALAALVCRPREIGAATSEMPPRRTAFTSSPVMEEIA